MNDKPIDLTGFVVFSPRQSPHEDELSGSVVLASTRLVGKNHTPVLKFVFSSRLMKDARIVTGDRIQVAYNGRIIRFVRCTPGMPGYTLRPSSSDKKKTSNTHDQSMIRIYLESTVKLFHSNLTIGGPKILQAKVAPDAIYCDIQTATETAE